MERVGRQKRAVGYSDRTALCNGALSASVRHSGKWVAVPATTIQVKSRALRNAPV